MIIHFVCRGNTYRSRLAEAYFNSLRIPHWKAHSSGIEASKNTNEDITWYAKNIIDRNKLTEFGKETWAQTTKEDLERADIVVFLSRSISDEAMKLFAPTLQDFEVWDVTDINPRKHDTLTDEEIANRTLQRIQRLIDEIAATLS